MVLLGLDVLRAELDLGVLGHPHHAAWLGGDDLQADLLQAEGALLEESLEDVLGELILVHPRLASVDRRRDDVAGDQRAIEQRAQQCLAASLQAHILLGRPQHDLLGRLELGGGNLDPVAHAHPGVGPDEPVEANDRQAVILGIRRQRNRRGHALAVDGDDVPLFDAQFFENLGVDAGGTLADVTFVGAGHLKSKTFFVLSHVSIPLQMELDKSPPWGRTFRVAINLRTGGALSSRGT